MPANYVLLSRQSLLPLHYWCVIPLHTSSKDELTNPIQIIGGWRDYKTSRFDFLVRGLLSCITLKKSFHIHLDHLRQNKVDGFCHSDISAIIGRLGAFHTFWLAPLEITVGVYFFYMLQGTAVLFLLPALIGEYTTCSIQLVFW